MVVRARSYCVSLNSGSWAVATRCGVAGSHSDFDFVAVSPAFAEQPDLFRALDRRWLWRGVGGEGLSLDLHCYTPEEYSRELVSLGYLGEANSRGELLRVPAEFPDAA